MKAIHTHEGVAPARRPRTKKRFKAARVIREVEERMRSEVVDQARAEQAEQRVRDQVLANMLNDMARSR